MNQNLNKNINKNIYADYNASAPLLSEVKEYLQKRISLDDEFANPNSNHLLGKRLYEKMEQARNIIAEELGVVSPLTPQSLIFNSGATEGISSVFHSILVNSSCSGMKKNLLILSPIEHKAVLKSAESLTFIGFEICYVKVSIDGLIDIQDLERILTLEWERAALVAIMAANNETGVIQPYEVVGTLCERFKVPFLCDTTQLISKVDFNFEKSKMDYAVVSSHKLGALIGSGILIVKDPLKFIPLLKGGDQENGYRAGTQNYLGIETLALALLVQRELREGGAATKLKLAQNAFEEELKSKVGDDKIVIFGGDAVSRLPGTSLISHPGLFSEAIKIELEEAGIMVSTAAACSDANPSPSHVIKCMGFSDSVARGSIRISVGLPYAEKCEEYYRIILDRLLYTYKKLNRLSQSCLK